MAPVLQQEVIKKSVVFAGFLLLLCFPATQAMDKRPSQDDNSLLRDLSFCNSSIEDIEITDVLKKLKEVPSAFTLGGYWVSYKVTQGEFDATLFIKKNRIEDFSVLFIGDGKDFPDSFKIKASNGQAIVVTKSAMIAKTITLILRIKNPVLFNSH